jgi:RING finger/CHY zinc finger protein 1
MDFLFDSREAATVLDCGHTLHNKCRAQLLQSNSFGCPICSVAMIDMSREWDIMRQEVADTPMPEEYRNKMVKILCNDCCESSENLFHVVGIECGKCGSFNTKRS